MAMRGGPRLAVGSAAWIAEERSSALQIAQSEIEEFSYSARNELDWLNEHMAEIFSENQMNVAELFKTPGKLRGKTPRTTKKTNAGETRVPLSDVFSATPKGASNPFAMAIANQARAPKINIAEDRPRLAHSRPASPTKAAVVSPRPRAKTPLPVTDSGYHGSPSQSQETMDHEMDADEATAIHSPERGVEVTDFGMMTVPTGPFEQIASPTAESEDTFQSAKEEQTRQAAAEATARIKSPLPMATEDSGSTNEARVASPIRSPQSPSPMKRSPVKSSSPMKQSPLKQVRLQEQPEAVSEPVDDVNAASDVEEDARSPSDKSSPIRPIMRKSSLAFASLPAREPLTSNKSLGGRMSRTSHLDQTRASYYNRHTGGKSLGQAALEDMSDDEHDAMDVDDDVTVQQETTVSNVAAHNKTYTQRLQDQISMLGKAQSNGPRPSKSIANLLPSQQITSAGSHHQQSSQAARDSKPLPPSPKDKHATTPGAFPDDFDDDWIAPPAKTAPTASPRPVMAKSYSTDVMEGVVGKTAVGGSEFVLPKSRPASPRKGKAPIIPERTTSAAPKHAKSASVPFLPSTMDLDELDSQYSSPKKGISVSNPTLATVSEDDTTGTPSSKSPSRTFRDSPLKQVKNKLSSILKSSKGLLASSAAISAEGKSSMLSPSATRLGYHAGASVESFRTAENVLYPDLSQHGASPSRPASPTRSNSTRRTRASAEREKREAKDREKEVKEAKRAADQMDKLEKARRKEEEKARVFSQEQERMELERKMAAQREQERFAMEQAKARARAEAEAKARVEAEAVARAQAEREAEAAAQAQAQAQAKATRSSPAKTPSKSPPKATRSSPRKAKAQAETEDTEMVDALSAMPPPSVPRSATSTAASRGQMPKRAVKPTKEVPTKTKQAPTVIRVNTTSAQHSQYHPSNSVLASTLQDTLGSQGHGSQRQLNTKSSHASLQTKPSLQSLKSSVSSTGRPKALELAAKRKEQEERETQRKLQVKAEMERKRAAMQEEERRREQQRRAEAEKQREEEQRQATLAAQAKKDAQRQAAIEKAKQTRAPPPAVRSQPTGPPEYNMADKGPSRPQSRLGSTMHQDASRPVNAVLSNASKMAQKRPLQQQEEESARPQLQRSGPSYQSKETKRMRMSEEFDEDVETAESQRNPIKGPPVRPSTGFKKELPQKNRFTNGYTPAPPQSATRDLFKATVTAQHSTQAKVAHPLDMAQVSKGAIPFAPNPNPAGPSHKTPARPAGPAAGKSAAKSATRSSPRFQNGESIELPDIDTDDEDDDDAHITAAAWADSPDLRRALIRQEAVDPMQIFGAPAPLNLEEVFNKHKDRWHKFRARTSSANWSGTDKLTEEDIRKDLQARDKMRREGGWSYELSKDM